MDTGLSNTNLGSLRPVFDYEQGGPERVACVKLGDPELKKTMKAIKDDILFERDWAPMSTEVHFMLAAETGVSPEMLEFIRIVDLLNERLPEVLGEQGVLFRLPEPMDLEACEREYGKPGYFENDWSQVVTELLFEYFFVRDEEQPAVEYERFDELVHAFRKGGRLSQVDLLNAIEDEDIAFDQDMLERLRQMHSTIRFYALCRYQEVLGECVVEAIKERGKGVVHKYWDYLGILKGEVYEFAKDPYGTLLLKWSVDKLQMLRTPSALGLYEAASTYVGKLEKNVEMLLEKNEPRLLEMFKGKLKESPPQELRLCFDFVEIGLIFNAKTDQLGFEVVKNLRRLKALEEKLSIHDGQYARLLNTYIKLAIEKGDFGVLIGEGYDEALKGNRAQTFYYLWLLAKKKNVHALTLLINLVLRVDYDKEAWDGFDYETFINKFDDFIFFVEEKEEEDPLAELFNMDMLTASSLLYSEGNRPETLRVFDEAVHADSMEALEEAFEVFKDDALNRTYSSLVHENEEDEALITLEKLVASGVQAHRKFYCGSDESIVKNYWIADAMCYLGIHFYKQKKYTSAYEAFNLARIHYPKGQHTMAVYYSSMMAYCKLGGAGLSETDAINQLLLAEKLGSVEANVFLNQLDERLDPQKLALKGSKKAQRRQVNQQLRLRQRLAKKSLDGTALAEVMYARSVEDLKENQAWDRQLRLVMERLLACGEDEELGFYESFLAEIE